jgi:quercetin dioxygenase-like cupin family protein
MRKFIFCIGLPFFAVAVNGQTTVKRVDLQRHDISVPGHEAIQVRVDFDPGVVAPAHQHPGEEIIYVLSGELEYTVAGQTPVTLKAGGVLFVPAGVVHSAKNNGSVVASELATYIVEKGKPLVVPAK